MRLLILATTAAFTFAACSTSPMNKTMKTSSKACKTQTQSVYFDTGSSDFDMEASETLNMIANAAEGCDTYRLELAGYADSVGSSPNNLALSEKRAQSVLGALSVRGVRADRIRVMSMGERQAVMDESPNQALRKVDVTLVQ